MFSRPALSTAAATKNDYSRDLSVALDAFAVHSVVSVQATLKKTNGPTLGILGITDLTPEMKVLQWCVKPKTGIKMLKPNFRFHLSSKAIPAWRP